MHDPHTLPICLSRTHTHTQRYSVHTEARNNKSGAGCGIRRFDLKRYPDRTYMHARSYSCTQRFCDRSGTVRKCNCHCSVRGGGTDKETQPRAQCTLALTLTFLWVASVSGARPKILTSPFGRDSNSGTSSPSIAHWWRPSALQWTALSRKNNHFPSNNLRLAEREPQLH